MLYQMLIDLHGCRQVSLGVEEAPPNNDADDPPKREAADEAGCPKGLLKEELEAGALLLAKKPPLLPRKPPLAPVDEPKLKPPPPACSRLLLTFGAGLLRP